MAMEAAGDQRWWSSKKKDLKFPLPSAPPTSFSLSQTLRPGERSSSALPHKQNDKPAPAHSPPRLPKTPDEDAELTQKIALIMQKELQKLKSDHPATQMLLPESVPRNTHQLQEPVLGVSNMRSRLEMEQLSKIKALEVENAGSLEKLKELQEEVEMLKGVVSAVADEKEELQEEMALLKVVVTSVSLEKEDLQEEVEMLKDVVRSVASAREQHMLKISMLEMELEESLEERRKLEEEVETLRSEQYVVTVQVQEFSY